MRVIAGKFRSQPLSAPKGRNTRPTSDRLRETLFNVIAPQIQGSVFADLFAGTGAVGIEALSRGSGRVYFAENAKVPLETLRHNLDKLQIREEAQIERGGTMFLLQRLLKEGIRLNLVFLDPPYDDRPGYETAMQFLAQHPILHVNAIVIVEHSKRFRLPEIQGNLQPYRLIRQGEAALTFFRCNTNDGSLRAP